MSEPISQEEAVKLSELREHYDTTDLSKEIETAKWEDSITCSTCQRVSYNSNDIEHRYCGSCGYHDQTGYARLTETQAPEDR